jgi:hypothetical protein
MYSGPVHLRLDAIGIFKKDLLFAHGIFPLGNSRELIEIRFCDNVRYYLNLSNKN